MTVDIAALVSSDIDAAVDSAALISSPYFATGRMDNDLGRLRQRVAKLKDVRPDLFARLAQHYDVAAVLQEVTEAIRADAVDRWYQVQQTRER